MYSGTLDPVSNRALFRFTRAVVDDETGEAVDLTGATALEFAIRERPDQSSWRSVNAASPLLVASLANGQAVVIAPNSFQVVFPRSDMVLLAPGEYDVGCTITLNGEEIQLIADAQLPVIDGVVDI